jgi:negative regulator of sigma E activity
MNEKVVMLKSKVKNFVTDPNTKAFAGMVAEYAAIAVVSIAITAGVKALVNNSKNATEEVTEEPQSMMEE